ncbi:cytochrome c oxidase subunit 3 [Methylocystis echinoides]|jgi:cytochrome c oxidase subunit 3|uniref:cytochrome c oxidase subunit 3 n=1 Tax=Methylocystis echinoides TaxID=29468 RepID=UPI0034177477
MADGHAKPQHDYHLVDPSPWPIAGAFAALATAIGAIMWMAQHKGAPIYGQTWGGTLFFAGFAAILAVMYGWWSDVVREAQDKGDHTPVVQLHHRYGMILFILSEVMFFVAWFWAFFNSSIFPDDVWQVTRTELFQGVWPPKGVEVLSPWKLPLLNTVILLTSGATLTWAHHGLLHNDRDQLKKGLIATIALGLLFTAIQGYEYAHAPFAFSFDPAHPAATNYGSTFFMATGFHGFHVIVGTLFLIVCLARAFKGHFKPDQHLGFEFAAWYWHFVDVVWLFLFFCIYVWGNWGGAME